MNKDDKKRLSDDRKKNQIIEAYRAYFPDIEKACDMCKIEVDRFYGFVETDYVFRARVESIRLNYFTVAENTLMNILLDDESSTHHKINASRVILQYKNSIKRI